MTVVVATIGSADAPKGRKFGSAPPAKAAAPNNRWRRVSLGTARVYFRLVRCDQPNSRSADAGTDRFTLQIFLCADAS